MAPRYAVFGEAVALGCEMVLYGFDISLRTKFYWKESEGYVIARKEVLKLAGGVWYLSADDVLRREGCEIWEWN